MRINIKSIATILATTLLLTGCSQTVSLLDYTTQEDLNSKGLTPEIIEQLDESNNWNVGYKYYNGNYQKHTIDKFEVLSNPSNPDEIFIIKDGNFLLKVNDEHIRIYDKGTKLPNPLDAVVDWNGQLLMYYNEKQAFYDQNLDGVEMISEKIPHKGEDYFLNYTEVIVEVPNDSITEVIIPDKQCYALAGDLACCMNEQGDYKPYRHQFLRGWEKHTSNSSTLISEFCNPDTAEQTRKTMLDHIKDPSSSE